MTLLARGRRRRALIGTVAVLAFGASVAGCGGSAAKAGGDPLTVMRTAKAAFDSASSVHLTMKTDTVPRSGNAVLGADGTLTHQPAFEGQVKVLFSGFTTSIPVVSVGGKVYAKIPLTPKFAAINPGDYGAPDPADFADPAKGISGLLLRLDGLKQAGQTRDGNDVLTTYSGTLSGSLVAPIIPSANAGGRYATVVGIDGSGRIATLAVTGDFFSGAGAVTYDLTFDDYGKNVTITKP
jgi:lipoprotein LprG